MRELESVFKFPGGIWEGGFENVTPASCGILAYYGNHHNAGADRGGGGGHAPISKILAQSLKKTWTLIGRSMGPITWCTVRAIGLRW